MRILHIATSLLFYSMLIAPIASVVWLGYSDRAEKPPRWQTTDVWQLLAEDSSYRSSVARNLISSTPVGMSAISAKSFLDYRVLGFVETSRVVSGERDWLYYKSQFFSGKCLGEETIQKVLLNMETTRILAEAADLTLTYSVAPDKSVVHPEHLGFYGSLAAGCKLESARRLRRRAKELGVKFIDYLEALEGAKPGTLRYSATGTHWNEYGRALAFTQLARTFGVPESKLVEPLPVPVASGGDVDLLRILRLDGVSPQNTYDKAWIDAWRKTSVPSDNMLILHDSFYKVSLNLLRTFLPKATWASYDDAANVNVALASALNTIHVNTVERMLIGRVLTGPLGWHGALGRSIVERNDAKAAKCRYRQLSAKEFALKNLDRRKGGEYAAKVDSQIIVPLQEATRPVCLRVRFTTDSRDATEVFLPRRQDDTYSAGMSILYDRKVGAKRILQLVLPTRYSGRRVRVDPVTKAGRLTDLTIETGTAN